MAKPLFDRKLGDQFIKTVPLCAGVYEILDATGTVIYVGKAKMLRRRLQQYRNARRCKKHHKMRAILAEAHSVRLTACDTDLAALLLENELIQKLKPRLNISGAFSFLYPCIGVRREGLDLHLCCTTTPGELAMFEFYGAYRSRHITREAFAALAELLEFIGHREPAKKLSQYPRIKFSSLAGYRQVGEHWLGLLDLFFRGESREFLEAAILALVEKPFARRHAERTQELLDSLVRFYKFEARPLRQAMKAAGLEGRGITQLERDRLFLKSRHARDEKRRIRSAAAARSS